MSSQTTSTKVIKGVKGKGTVQAWGTSKSPNTRYRAKLPVILPDGKKRTIYGYGLTKTAASRDLDGKVQLTLKKHPSASTLTFHQAFAKLLEAKKMGGKKQKTLAERRRPLHPAPQTLLCIAWLKNCLAGHLAKS